MNIIKQITLLFIIWALGEVFHSMLKNILPIPGSILGMILLFILLNIKVIKHDEIRKVITPIVDNMTLFIIPIGVSLYNYGHVIRTYLIPMLICGIIITVISIVVLMKFVDVLVSRQKQKEGI